MSYDLHVAAGAVEVGEDIRRLVGRQRGAVPAARLARAGQDVHHAVFKHVVYELGGLAAQLVVEAPPGLQDVLRRANGAGVAVGEPHGAVGVAHGQALAQALRHRLVHAVGYRHDVVHDGGAEALHVGLVVAVALHTVVAQGDVAVVPQLPPHLVAQRHQLGVDGVQALRVLGVPGVLSRPGGGAAGRIRVLLYRRELRERVHAALKGYLRPGQEL